MSDSIAPLTLPPPSPPSVESTWSGWRITAGVATAVTVAAARFVHLDEAPGEWYGDIERHEAL